MSTIIPYSGLPAILEAKDLSVPELHREMCAKGTEVNIKTLYRLARAEPVERVDLRVAGAICEIFDITLNDLFTFEAPEAHLTQLTDDQQERLQKLMGLNNSGKLNDSEKEELTNLVELAEALTLKNARILARQRKSFGKAS